MDKRSISQQLVDTAGEVIIEAVKFGLDEAGARLLGPTAWNVFKRVVAPVVKRLQRRFPVLSFGKPGDKTAEAVAQDAVQYLHINTGLQNLLLENFNHLSEGQEEILAGIWRLEGIVQKTAKDVEDIQKISNEILVEIKRERGETAAQELPTWVDVSDIIDETYLFMRTRARRQGEQLNIPFVTTVLIGLGIGTFMERVLEEGRSLKLYKSKIGGEIVTIRASGKYRDEKQRICRKFTIDVPVLGEPQRHFVTHEIACRIEGSWKTTEVLERSEY